MKLADADRLKLQLEHKLDRPVAKIFDGRRGYLLHRANLFTFASVQEAEAFLLSTGAKKDGAA